MDEEIVKLLDEGIKTELKSLLAMTLTDDEKADAIDDLVKLYKLRIEESKIRSDFEEAHLKLESEKENRIADTLLKEKQLHEDAEARKSDERIKSRQLKEDAKNRYFRFVIEGVEIILPLIFYAVWMRRGFKFEETGAFTSLTFRNFINRFRPTRKS